MNIDMIGFIFWDGIFSGRLRYDIYKIIKLIEIKNFYMKQEPKDPELFIQKERVKQYAVKNYLFANLKMK